MGSTYRLAWWNVENLFDEEDSPRRSDKLKRALGKSIQGWTPELRDRKIAQLATVIAQMHEGAGPDLLGVCEVENEFVLTALAEAINDLLPGRDYRLAHADTVDRRGIDIAFLYDPALFTVTEGQIFQHVVMRRTGTRELLQVNFDTADGLTWAVFGNHWPSRSGGQFESAPYRAVAAETLAYFHQRVLEVHGPDTPVLAMGDFNDEPHDRSLTQHALSTRQRTKVLAATTAPRLWNLTWPLAGGHDGADENGDQIPAGTFYFNNYANVLDQFLAGKNMIGQDSPLRAEPGSVRIVREPAGLVAPGKYPAPVPFGGMGKPVNTDGYSDHYPITMHVHQASA
ncbi:endonuclease/exonuclease/phosphatase family protein [Glycomyces sp. L485]|uniref:endonuclease/exonuclease/phosphatase family protein n=1 Tax=Glycomyces sp. L485 TaxID=2909235 RepID=UPI001F4B985F|nr:endonuclease/exonuclease/phosphatase family protein [Glycomyces sp. L485]MCH7229945.1 endonuclease/exonuclease/phosphatase family protein [Glycomyces sp. L485]